MVCHCMPLGKSHWEGHGMLVFLSVKHHLPGVRGHEEIFHSSRMRVMLENAGVYLTKLLMTWKMGKLRPKMSEKKLT